ncbi:MAG: Holliday junction branch migration protein RuvA [Ilumatobacter sp.]|uniref:Holliday junction branch migration protein RuvA n=1 Tax=Ilumatobacter sp. TaxID=1967498 RepID=UPI003C766F1A
MIGSLRGEVLDRNLDTTVLIEVAGVGYIVSVTERTLAELEPGTETFLYIHHHVTETAETLFGFRAKDERITFQTLIKTNGVGPSIAMAVLATHPPTALVDIVANNDVAALTLVSGIGKKTAERMMVELRDRLSLPMLDSGDATSPGSAVAEVREALAGLGYGTDEIRDVLRDLPSDAPSATLLRDALKSLGAKRA